MNFEPVLKGAVVVVSFFRNVFWETWGVLGTNLVPGTHDPLVSVEAEGETILAAMAASSGFSSCVVKVTKL